MVTTHWMKVKNRKHHVFKRVLAEIVPFDRDLELAVIDAQGIHALVFPCRRGLRG